MDIQSIFEAGGTVIKNPNYKKGKKNTQPEYITVSDLNTDVPPTGSAVANIAYTAAAKGNQGILGRNDELDKYVERGLTPNDWENLDKQLADMQSAWSKWGNALGQTLVSEIGLGTVKGFVDLFDVLTGATLRNDGDYSNPVSQYLEEQQEAFRNWAPIYTDPDVNITNGGLIDAGWWASNLPSVASSLTLMIPSAGVTKSVSAIGSKVNAGRRMSSFTRKITGASKAIKNGKNLNKFQRVANSSSTANATKLFLENGTTAVLSRAVENYQEGRQTYNDMYVQATEAFEQMNDDDYQKVIKDNEALLKEQNIDPNDKDAVAKAIAKQAADVTFKLDWANVGWDVIQIYALRNAWKGIKNAPDNSAAVRRAQKDAIKYAGKYKSEAELKALKAKRKFKEKAKEWAEDRLYGSKLLITAEASEGAEEALNYVAQQEGIHFGNVLLGKEQGDKEYSALENMFDGFDGRLHQYVQAPELWDAAFWGVMGGVVFQSAGSGFNRIANKLTSKKSDANEESQASLPWYQLDHLPETKRRISEIHARAIDAANYKEKLDRINAGEDIYRSTDNEKVEFINDSEQKAAREKLKNEYIANMTLRAMRTGNLDMLKAYLGSDEVRKAMIERGLFGKVSNTRTQAEIEADSKKYIEDALRRMEKVEEMYDNELIAVNEASAYVDKYSDYDGSVPVEYMQIIANNNVHNMLMSEAMDIELIGISERIAQLEAQFADNLDPNIDYKGNIRLGVLTNELGRLRAERKRLVADKSKALSNQISIEAIDKRIASIEADLSDAELAYATFMSLRYTETDNGQLIQEDTAEAFAYRDQMITRQAEKQAGKIYTLTGLETFGLSDRTRTALDEAGIGAYSTLESDAATTFRNLRQISPELDSLYQRKAAIEKSKDFNNLGIARTVSEVKDAIGELHNTMNEARATAISTANNTLLRLYKKHGIRIKDCLYESYNGKSDASFDRDDMTDSELAELRDAIDILALTKSYNKSLIDVIFKLFDVQDAIIAGQKVENATSENGNTDDKSPEADNLSTGTSGSTTDAQNGQNGGNPGVTNSQQTENRTPSFYVNVYGNRSGKLELEEPSFPDSSSVAVYDNGDGTFTLDVRNEKRFHNDDRMFSNTGEVDLTRPYEVVTKPIAARSKKHKLEIVRAGTLRNTDTSETQQRPASEQQGEQQPAAQSQQAGAQSSKPATSPTSPSTGEHDNGNNGNQQPIIPSVDQTQPDTTIPPVESIIDQQAASDAVFADALKKFIAEVKRNNNADLDEIANTLIEAQVKSGTDRTLVETAITKAKTIIQHRLEGKRSNSANTMQDLVDNIIVTQSSITEQHKDYIAIREYKEAVKQLMSQYAKELNIQKVNGILYVNLEDLLRYVNTTTADSSTAGIIYLSLKEYLKTNEAKKQFVVMDEASADSSDFLKNVGKSEEERRQELFDDGKLQRIDIDSFISEAAEQEREKFYDALDALSKGDQLNYEVKNSIVYIKDKQGQVVGTLPVPGIDSNTGGYVMYNDGWLTDVLSNNGTITSSLRDLFVFWFTGTTSDTEEIRDIIYELAYTRPTDEQRKELYSKLDANKEWEKSKKQGYTASNAPTFQLANHLTKLLKYITQPTTDTVTIRNIQLTSAINSWFTKLNNSYDAVVSLSKKTDMTISVGEISDGELIRIVDFDRGEVAQQAIPVNEAIAGGVNPAVHKIAIGDNYATGRLKVSGRTSQSLSGVGGGNTFVLIPNRNGQFGYAQAFLAKVTDDYIGQDAKDIIDAIHREITNLLTAHATTPSDKTYNNLKKFFRLLLSNKEGNSSLFNKLTFTETEKYFSIGIPNTSNYIIFWHKDTNGNIATLAQVSNDEFEANAAGKKTKNLSYNDDVLRSNIGALVNNLSFQMTMAYIDSDNKADMTLKGLARRESGKFTISIGEQTWTYSSYNEFMLRNNLLRLNTKPSNDGKSNYLRKGERSQGANQVFKIKIDHKVSSPVEGQQQPSSDGQPKPPTSIPVNQQVQQILNSDSHDKGVDIVKAVIGTDSVFTEETLKAFQQLNLLPKNIKFDPNFNNKQGYESVNAEVNPATGEVTVGQRWLNMFSNPNSRKQAVRKLIHEQLHNALYKQNGYISSAQQIYDEFKTALNDGTLKTKGFADDTIAHLKQYLFEGNQHSLEEFLVESLTSEELATALNTIDAAFDKKRGRRNLFQKILELMSKVFGWNVREGSLYEKELHTLRKAMNDTIEDRSAVESAAETVNKIHQDGEKVNLTADEKYYLNEETGTLGVRVTSAIQADEENIEEVTKEDGTTQRVPKRFDKNSPWITPSTNIGTGIDEFVRDFFLDKLDTFSAEDLEKQYPNVRGADWIAFRDKLKEFRNNLREGRVIKRKQITIVSRDIKAVGQVDVQMPDGTVKKLDVTGTLDLLGYDQDGKFYVFDMKTVRSDNYMNDADKNNKWNRQLQLYKQFLEDKYGIKVAATGIIPIKVNYDTPTGATYKDGTDMGGTANYAVKDASLKTDYSNPMRSQLLQDGEEFRDAAPELKPLLEKHPHKGNIKYEYLDVDAKAILDGTVTADAYKQQEAKVNSEQKPVIVPPTEGQATNRFGNNARGNLRGRFKSSITEISNVSRYSQEMQFIKDEAIAAGIFMKSPNGNPTNLNERQWLQVRTKNFKDWFGAWENNPSEASKVVDENGEPLVVYHGNRTDNRITIFDPSKKGSEHKGRSISGFWFITDNEVAKIEYALKPESKGRGEEHLEYGEVIPVFLNIKNPVITEQRGITVSNTSYGSLTTTEEKLHNFIERSKNRSNENTDGYILTLVDSDNRADDFVSKQTQLVVFNSNQIKSATSNNGEFSTTDNDIRHSSVTEHSVVSPSVPAFASRLPLHQQAKFGNLVARGEISVACR